MTESLCCTAEIDTALKINYTLKKKKKNETLQVGSFQAGEVDLAIKYLR